MNQPSPSRRLARVGTLAAAALMSLHTVALAMDETAAWAPNEREIKTERPRLISGLTPGKPFPAETTSVGMSISTKRQTADASSHQFRSSHRTVRAHTTAALRSVGTVLRTPPRRARPPAGTRRSGTSFFGTAAIRFSNIATARDWNRVRAVADDASFTGICLSAACQARVEKIRLFSAAAEDASFLEKLQAANSLVNRSIAYQEDRVVYRRLDYWASPAETARRGIGDCEDFAILKYNLLLNAGVPAKSMSLVVLKDTKRDLYHAVLAVSTNKGHYILDNVVDRVYLDKEVSHYQPLFSFSADRSWLHGRPAGNTQQKMVAIESVAPGTDRPAGVFLAPASVASAGQTDVTPVFRD
ncbi:transglutaminase-like cysteine peptidase [Roseibium sp. MMSF_3544]|uniref:transglutaminase-like cysteine peptidase n=1 Tax=unclassified Roseibium TaxID=2629323 RepID=UPI00273ECDFF|nr:transglutaminase-like cysteine peptidase [Roseibium sp. MMSF_3544]